MSELLQIYKRLRKTIRLNQVHSSFNHPLEAIAGDELVYTDSLIRSFGFSIASVEISQRGVQSEPGATLLDKIPQLTLTHLRVLAETALSYAAIGSLQNGGSGSVSRSAAEFRDMLRHKVVQLFLDHPALSQVPVAVHLSGVDPLLSKDIFVFLAESSLSLLPVLQIDIRHLLQLCYVAEIVKVAVAYIVEPRGLKHELARNGDAHYLLDVELSDEHYNHTKHFFDSIVAALRANSADFGYVKDGEGSATPGVVIALRRLTSRYALTFLRKAVILLHVQHGVEFPNTGLDDGNELDRLTKALSLPVLEEIFAAIKSPFAGADPDPLNKVVRGWISHWNAFRVGSRLGDPQLPSLSHPAIFELVGLPKYYDSLIEEANRRRCPNSKKELTDPSICLFCGDIFCSQAVCCMENKKLGGCNQHLQKYESVASLSLSDE